MSIVRSDGAIEHPGLPLPVVLKPHPRARRWKLRVDHARQVILVTCPPRASRRAALAWAADQRAWVDARLADSEPGIALSPGAVIPFEGREVRLDWLDGAPRTVRLTEAAISCGGPSEGFDRRILSWLKARARTILSEDTARFAKLAGVSVRSVSVGDADTRWGSCSASGAIRYNWRLILAPPAIRRFVVAHEVAHRVHLNHGPAFKALEAELYDGDPAEARSELRRISSWLKRVGRLQ